MKVEIAEKYAEYIRQTIDSGSLSSPEQVVEDALERVMKNRSLSSDELMSLLRPSVEQFERGEGVPLEQAMADLREWIGQETAKRLQPR